MRHPVLLLDEYSDVADKVYPVAHSTTPTRTEDITAGRPTFNAVRRLSIGNSDSFEIPKTPLLVTEKMRCLVNPLVVRVVGKRLDTR